MNTTSATGNVQLEQWIGKAHDLLKTRHPGYEIYPESVQESDGITIAVLKDGSGKFLLLATSSPGLLPGRFSARQIVSQQAEAGSNGNLILFTGTLDETNAAEIRRRLPWTAPVLIGNRNSFGFGDRLGNAGTAHLRSLENSGFMPIIAQQSIREMDRTRRSAQEVIDCATWAVLQCGFTGGFGSDADHLKTMTDIDRTMEAGFTMFTIDPGDHVDNRSTEMSADEIEKAFLRLPWVRLEDSPDAFLSRYAGRKFALSDRIELQPSESDILRAAVKYGFVIAHTAEMFRYLREAYSSNPAEVELSVDETPEPTTPAEHLIIASELKRLGVELVSLAPRFCGEFEKGIDFKGDLNEFKREYLIHQAIAANYGNYKLSIHSGSDKFNVYAAIGELNVGTVHVKTAGTSYLEALRAISMTNPDLFREIIAFAADRFEMDRKTYHISADLKHFPDEADLSNDQLPGLLDDDNARQIFHVTFGSVLTTTNSDGNRVYYERFMSTLADFDDVYEDCLYRHFRRHLRPFEGN